MSSPTNEELVKYGVQLGQIPRYFYKYRAPDVGTTKVFTDHTVWFSSPEKFNDPFDCQIVADTNNTLEEIEQFIIRADPSLQKDSALIKNLASKAFADPRGWSDSIHSIIKKHMNNTGVSCFSTEYNSILMWSYYSDSHKGLCLKFDVLADPNLFVTPLRVVYDEEYPVYNHIRNSNELANKLLKTKAKVWEHENEWRVIKPNAPGAHYFKKESLVEVLFGCNATDQFIEDIRKEATKSGLLHLTYKKAEVSQTEFAITFKDLT